MKTVLAEAIDSIKTTMVTDPRDWGLYKRDAWIYGIVIGWKDALPEIAEKFKWKKEDVLRLQKYHAEFQRHLKSEQENLK